MKRLLQAEGTKNRVSLFATVLPPVPVWQGRDGIYTLLSDYSFQCQRSGCRITAPEGFEFDGHSIPRLGQLFLQPFELSPVAALFHDLEYRYRGHLPPGLVEPYQSFVRSTSDARYYDLMTIETVAEWRKRVAYTAVRSPAGARAWGSKKPQYTLRDQ